MLARLSFRRVASLVALSALLGATHCSSAESTGSSASALTSPLDDGGASDASPGAGSIVQVANWVQATPAASPPPRSRHALTYDRARQRVVLFGGQGSNNTPLGDTWEWDGATWTDRSSTSGPPARADHALAYDVGRQRTVLFGGATADTWEWDGTTWQQRTPATSPPATRQAQMAYDVGRGRTVLFGGLANFVRNDTWEWDGSTWSQSLPKASPPSREVFGMAYDPGLGRVVVVGGADVFMPRRDTWGWDGTTWTWITGWNPPSATAPQMVYDTAQQRLVVVIGGAPPGRVYTLDGKVWRVAIEPVFPSGAGPVAYDEARGNVVLFQGGKTWILTLVPTKVGNACAADADCPSGHCVDHVCCATKCDRQCEACSVPGHEGVCLPVSGSPVGARPACLGSGACGGQCDGLTPAACTYPPAQASCGAATCTAGVATAAAACDGAGKCVGGGTTACGAYACGATSCNTSCTTSADCATGNVCLVMGVCGPPLVALPAHGTVATGSSITFHASGGSGSGYTWTLVTNASGAQLSSAGAYVAGPTISTTDIVRVTDSGLNSADVPVDVVGRALGIACTRDSDCGAGHCADHFCCNTACTGQCEACNVQANEGMCIPVTGEPTGGRAACGGTGVCAGRCDGSRTDACTFPTVACRAASCSADTGAAEAFCDNGVCPASATRSCAPFACAATDCKTSCADDTDCAPGLHCLLGHGSPQCVAQLPTDAGVLDAGHDASPDGGPDASPAPDAGEDSSVADSGPNEPADDAGGPDAALPSSDAGAVIADAARPVVDATDTNAAEAGPSETGTDGSGCSASGRRTGSSLGWLSAPLLLVALRRVRRRARAAAASAR